MLGRMVEGRAVRKCGRPTGRRCSRWLMRSLVALRAAGIWEVPTQTVLETPDSFWATSKMSEWPPFSLLRRKIACEDHAGDQPDVCLPLATNRGSTAVGLEVLAEMSKSLFHLGCLPAKRPPVCIKQGQWRFVLLKALFYSLAGASLGLFTVSYFTSFVLLEDGLFARRLMEINGWVKNMYPTPLNGHKD